MATVTVSALVRTATATPSASIKVWRNLSPVALKATSPAKPESRGLSNRGYGRNWGPRLVNQAAPCQTPQAPAPKWRGIDLLDPRWEGFTPWGFKSPKKQEARALPEPINWVKAQKRAAEKAARAEERAIARKERADERARQGAARTAAKAARAAAKAARDQQRAAERARRAQAEAKAKVRREGLSLVQARERKAAFFAARAAGAGVVVYLSHLGKVIARVSFSQDELQRGTISSLVGRAGLALTGESAAEYNATMRALTNAQIFVRWGQDSTIWSTSDLKYKDRTRVDVGTEIEVVLG